MSKQLQIILQKNFFQDTWCRIGVPQILLPLTIVYIVLNVDVQALSA